MSRDDTDVTGAEVDNLDLSSRAARESKLLLRETAQAEEVVGCFVVVKQLGRFGKGVDAHAVLKDDGDVLSTQLSAANGADGCDFQRNFSLEIVPDDGLHARRVRYRLLVYPVSK